MIEHDRRNCRCGDPSCAAASAALDIEIANGIDQSWVEPWKAGDYRKEGWFGDLVKWMKSRPPGVKEMMRKFPPECILRAKPGQHLRVPHNGYVGQLGGFVFDRENDQFDLAVRHTPTSESGAIVAADAVEVVGYHAGLTPEAVATILADA